MRHSPLAVGVQLPDRARCRARPGPAQTPARMLTPFSPMPPVKTIASAPPSSTSMPPRCRRISATNTSSASLARALPCAAASSRSRTSPLTPRQAEQARLLGQRVEHLVAATCPSACMITGSANGSKSPTRLLCGRPVCGLMPIDVATLCWPRIAHRLLEPPRWHEMIRRSSRPSSSARPLGDVAMARAVKAPPLDVQLLGPLVRARRSTAARSGIVCVKAGLERRHQRNLRQLLGQQPHRRDVRRIVGRRDLAHLFHRRQHVGRHPLHAADAPAVHRLEADRRHFAGVLAGSRCAGSVSCSRHCRTATAWSGTGAFSSCRWPPISTKQRAFGRADPLDAAARKLPLVGHVEQPILEAGRAEVGDEDLHGELPVVRDSRRVRDVVHATRRRRARLSQ